MPATAALAALASVTAATIATTARPGRRHPGSTPPRPATTSVGLRRGAARRRGACEAAEEQRAPCPWPKPRKAAEQPEHHGRGCFTGRRVPRQADVLAEPSTTTTPVEQEQPIRSPPHMEEPSRSDQPRRGQAARRRPPSGCRRCEQRCRARRRAPRRPTRPRMLGETSSCGSRPWKACPPAERGPAPSTARTRRPRNCRSAVSTHQQAGGLRADQRQRSTHQLLRRVGITALRESRRHAGSRHGQRHQGARPGASRAAWPSPASTRVTCASVKHHMVEAPDRSRASASAGPSGSGPGTPPCPATTADQPIHPQRKSSHRRAASATGARGRREPRARPATAGLAHRAKRTPDRW